MNERKKISYRSLTEKMSDEKLKAIIAGSGSGEGSCKLKCTNDSEDEETNFWVKKCPPSEGDMKLMCQELLGYYGDFLSCSGSNDCHVW